MSKDSTMMFQLAAAEAEAEALRKELAARRGNRDQKDLSKLNPATPEKRIDGTGYRETIFSGPGKTTGNSLLPCLVRGEGTEEGNLDEFNRCKVTFDVCT